MGGSSSSVHLPAMTHSNHENRTALVVDFVEDAIVPNPKAVAARLALQLRTSNWARVLRKRVDMRADPRTRLRREPSKLPRRGG